MDYEFLSLAERRIHEDIEKMFGDKDSELKMITKFAKLKELYGNDAELNENINNTLRKMRQSFIVDKKMITEEMRCTLDASGNVVLLTTD